MAFAFPISSANLMRSAGVPTSDLLIAPAAVGELLGDGTESRPATALAD